MASPYIEQEAERLGIGSHADHNHDDFHFVRQRPSHRWGELERSDPLRAWTRDVMNGILLIVFMVGSFYLMDIVAEFCEIMGWCA